jgi:hypothetical protein
VNTITILSRSRNRDHQLQPYVVWGVQALLAATFLFTGVTKLVMSGEDLTKDIDLPVAFLRFIGVCEVLGALGMILPGVLRIRRGLTPIAACGLVVIMIGATIATIVSIGVAPAFIPFVVGLLAVFVAYARWPWLTEGTTGSTR